MRMHRFAAVSAAVTVLSTLGAAAQQQPPAAQEGRAPPRAEQRQPEQRQADAVGTTVAPAGADALAPFTGADTLAVARVDLARADLKAAEQWLLDVVKNAEVQPAAGEQVAGQVSGSLAAAQNWVSNLKQAGANQIFLVLSAPPAGRAGVTAPQEGRDAPSPEGQQAPVGVVVVPLAQGADSAAIRKLLEPQGNQPAIPGRPEARVMHNAVVLAQPQVLDNLARGKPGDAESLTEAMSAVADASVQVAFNPTGRLGSALQALPIPANVRQPAQDLQLARNTKWAAVGFDLPKKQAMKMVIRAQSPEAAEQLAAQVRELLESASKDDAAPQLAGSTELLKPTVNGDLLTVTLSQEQAERLLKQGLSAAMPGAPAGTSPGATQQPGQAPKPDGSN